MVSHLTSFRYVEVEGEIIETPFQAFEAVNTVKTPRSQVVKSEAPIVSLKDAQVAIETGGSSKWGQMIEVHPKHDKKGLGFNVGHN